MDYTSKPRPVNEAFERFAAEQGIASYRVEPLTPGRHRIIIQHNARTFAVSVSAKVLQRPQ